ncbi:hypothetical protein [Streptomyces coryli]|uniref:hypothetical protein n=1 Tax=Streptomyces coryli TaxID=1128680 RepID=UPI001F0F122C|nr:hypothetical protein [Streptomyces coryli]
MASAYAEFARRCGWLRPDRVLGAQDVTAEFGAPSVLFGGSNPLYGKTLGYLSEDPEQPIVFFHLWNGAAEPGGWPPEHEQPLLLAVRFGEGPFRRSFTFTPEGERRRPAAATATPAPPGR